MGAEYENFYQLSGYIRGPDQRLSVIIIQNLQTSAPFLHSFLPDIELCSFTYLRKPCLLSPLSLHIRHTAPPSIPATMKFQLLSPLLLSTLALAAPNLQPRQTRSERVDCYNVGAGMSAEKLVHAIGVFCKPLQGQIFKDGRLESRTFKYADRKVIIEMRAEPGCSFTVDDNCYRLLKLPLQRCNGGSEVKQGGLVVEEPMCGWYRIDPNVKADGGI